MIGKYFLPFCGLLFYFVNSAFWAQSVLIFMSSSMSGVFVLLPVSLKSDSRNHCQIQCCENSALEKLFIIIEFWDIWLTSSTSNSVTSIITSLIQLPDLNWNISITRCLVLCKEDSITSDRKSRKTKKSLYFKLNFLCLQHLIFSFNLILSLSRATQNKFLQPQ